MRSKLIEIVKNSTKLAKKMNYGYYWLTDDGQIITNILVVKWWEKEFNTWVKFVCTPEYMAEFKEALKDKTIDMNHNYNLDLIKRLKKEYEHVALLYSGGYDSQRIFLDFVENDIRIDETVLQYYTETEDIFNEEFRQNALPSLADWRHMVDKQTFLYTTEDDVLKHYSDEWAFFNRPMTGLLSSNNMGTYPLEHLYKGASYQDWGASEHHEQLEMNPNGCFIKGMDKPQLVYYKQKWYVTCIDTIFGDRHGLLNTIFFWLHPGNVKGLIKEARIYRDFILDYKYGIDVNSKEYQLGKMNLQDSTMDSIGTLAFFKFYNQDNHNYVIGRPEIYNADKKIPKVQKMKTRKNIFVENDRWDIVTKYSRCMEKLLELFPECSKGFTDFNNKGKFAWLIDIDKMEIFTQQELIPDGFVT